MDCPPLTSPSRDIEEEEEEEDEEDEADRVLPRPLGLEPECFSRKFLAMSTLVSLVASVPSSKASYLIREFVS